MRLLSHRLLTGHPNREEEEVCRYDPGIVGLYRLYFILDWEAKMHTIKQMKC